jgi:hypothetical protein
MNKMKLRTIAESNPLFPTEQPVEATTNVDDSSAPPDTAAPKQPTGIPTDPRQREFFGTPIGATQINL